MSLGKNLNIKKGSKPEKDEKQTKAGKKKKATPSVKKKPIEKPVVEEVQPIVEESTAENQQTAVVPIEKSEEVLPEVKKESLPEAPLGAQELIDKLADDAPMIAEGQNMLVVFPVGDEEYAISIDDIKEVVPAPPIAIIPQVPKYVKGVANVRGNVLAVLDLSLRFAKKTDKEVGENKFVLVIKSEAYQVAVHVNSVPTTMMVADSDVDPPSNVISNTTTNVNYIKGIIKEEKRMIVWININEVLDEIYSKDLAAN